MTQPVSFSIPIFLFAAPITKSTNLLLIILLNKLRHGAQRARSWIIPVLHLSLLAKREHPTPDDKPYALLPPPKIFALPHVGSPRKSLTTSRIKPFQFPRPADTPDAQDWRGETLPGSKENQRSRPTTTREEEKGCKSYP